jgi:glycosyltransferase involved in cell wall biosynthesis
MNPLVSVVIANYNSEKYIKEAIESILNQTYKNLELIIVDDNSSDNSLSIIKSISAKNSRINLIEQNENKGVTYSRQNGLENAKGKYVAILDSDDISLPTRIEEQVKILDQNSEVVLVSSYYGVIDENSKVKRKLKKVHANDAAIKWFMTFGNCFAHSTIMFRLSIAMEFGGYDMSIKRGLDMELSQKLLTKGKAYTVPKVLSYWRTYSKSMTKSVNKNELEKNYISSVQNSIYLHLGKKVNFETAHAIFYNYRKPSQNIQSLLNAFELINFAFEKYSQVFFKKDLQVLKKSVLKHLLKIYERNVKEIWWNEIENDWLKTFKKNIEKRDLYNLVYKNYTQLTSRNIKNLLLFKLKQML